MQPIHHRLRNLRREKNLSQEDLAQKLGISRQALIAIEQGASLPSLRVIMALLSALNTTFNDLFGPDWSPFRTADDTPAETSQLALYSYQDRQQSMAVTFTEDQQAFHVYAELPGVKEDDLTVDLSQQHALIVAIKRPVSVVRDTIPHINEIVAGPCLRVISMPSPIDPDRASAQFTHGLLHLTLPKHLPETSRRITFSANGTLPETVT